MAAKGGRSTRQWMLWAFKLHGCADCGASYPDIPLSDLHCDHRDPTTRAEVTDRNIVGGTGLIKTDSHDALLRELLKCDVVCVSCHHERHRNRRRNGTYVQQTLFQGTGQAWR